MFQNRLIKYLAVASLLFGASCSATNSNQSPTLNSSKAEVEEDDKSKHKVDGKKLAKEAGSMIAADVVLASICKTGLHLSVGVCLVADVLGDAGIIAYNNTVIVEEIDPKSGQKVQKQEVKMEALDFLLGITLMAITLVLI